MNLPLRTNHIKTPSDPNPHLKKKLSARKNVDPDPTLLKSRIRYQHRLLVAGSAENSQSSPPPGTVQKFRLEYKHRRRKGE